MSLAEVYLASSGGDVPRPTTASIALPNPIALAPTAAPVASHAAVAASKPDAWRAEWNASPALQAEFPNVEGYTALRQGEASGRVKVIAKAPAAVSLASTPDEWRAEWRASAALQAEFADAG
ncbi:MAG: hypothetical protein Q8M07_07295, partial [Prosthecobacter sp.]|nr:hypothetical protein [Prosthecobacter sp.]